MPLRPMNKHSKCWTDHKDHWSDCVGCPLSKNRTRVVLFRGQLPCTILLVGEAPGSSEDVLGRPFVGPAGKLLDSMIDEAKQLAGVLDIRLGFTNLVCCVPLVNQRTVEPRQEDIILCSTRLNDLVRLARPKAIVMIGKLSSKFSPKLIDWDFTESCDILHPAAILRADPSQRIFAYQKALATLVDIFERTTNAAKTNDK